MSRYEKISSGSGSHGVKYEVNLLLYYLLKSYQSKENFQLSNGKKDKLKMDDIVLESDTFTVFVQAKHIDNEAKKITKTQFFGETGKFSLLVYLQVAYEIFKQMNNVSDEYLEDLQSVSNEKINSLLTPFSLTSFHLVTNISPNGELASFTNSSYFDPIIETNFKEIKAYYNFKSAKSDNELSELAQNLNIPNWFTKSFLQNFCLVVISDNKLKDDINGLLKLLSSNLQIPNEVSYKDMYELIEDWQSKRTGVYLNRNEVNDTFFSPLVSRKFKQELKTRENLIEFDINPLLRRVEDSLVTVVETTRYLPIMTVLQKNFAESGVTQTLFVNPVSDVDKQKLLIKAFLHQKFTHLICSLQYSSEEVIPLLGDVIFEIEQNEKFIKYKKIIIFCGKDANIGTEQNRSTIDDSEWFKERKLHINKTPISLGEVENYYIDRELIRQNDKYSEDEFLKNVVETENDFFVIADSPGMGKTMILLSLATKINKRYQFWAFIIQLNRYTELLESHMESKTTPCLQEFLYITIENNFDRQICEIPNIIILMVDGFDEISPDYADVTTDFLRNIRSMENVKTTVVTTRKHLKEQLENNLMEEAYGLEPFTDDDVCSVINKFREQSCDSLVLWNYAISKGVREFLSVPLHARMFAEISSVSTSNLYDLYDAFLNKKKDIFIREKCGCQGNVYTKKLQNEKFQNLLETYMEIALELTFKKEILEVIGVTKTVARAFNEELCANGILEYFQTSIRFVHQTFKDFFVAKWAVKKMFDNKEPDYKILKIIFKEILMNFYANKQFIESYLKQHWAEIPDNLLVTIGSMASNFDKSTDTILYYHENPYITRLIVEKCENLSLINRLYFNIIETEKVINQTGFILLLINKGADLNQKSMKGRTLLHIAAEKGNLELVKHLVEEKLFDVDEEDNEELTPFILAVLKNNEQIYTYLFEKATDVKELLEKLQYTFLNYRPRFPNGIIKFFSNFSSRIPNSYNSLLQSYFEKFKLFLYAYMGDFDSVIKCLSEKEWNLNEYMYDNWSILHCAARSGKLNMVKYFLSLNVNVDGKTNCGENVLHLAAQSGNIDLVKYLIVKLGIKIDTKTEDDETALDIAIEYKHSDVVQYLLETYSKLEDLDISSICKALCIAAIHTYNDLFKSIHKKHIKKFSPQRQLVDNEFLFVAIRHNNAELVRYIFSENICHLYRKSQFNMNCVHYAALTGQLDIIKMLVDLNAQIDEKSAEGKNALHYAVEGGNNYIVQYLIGLNVDKHATTLRDENALHIAALKGNLKVVKYLVDANVNPKVISLGNKTVLHYASVSGKLFLVKYLVSLNLNIHEKTLCGMRALHYAAFIGSFELLTYLIDLKMALNEKPLNGLSVLHFAAHSGKIELVKYLVSLNMDIHETSPSEMNILHYAAQSGNLEVVKYVLELGIAIDSKALSGRRILHFAAERGHLRLIKYLVTLNLKLNEKTLDGLTVLHYAVGSGNLQLVKFLVGLEIKVDEKTFYGETILHYAAQSGKLNILKYLIGLNLVLDDKTIRGESVLHYAAKSGNKEIVKYLINLNLNKNEKTLNNENILHFAARTGNIILVKYLTSLNVGLHEKTVNGETVLHYAARSGNTKVVDYLLSLNLDKNEKTVNGETILHYAALSKSIDLVSYLINSNMEMKEKTVTGKSVLHYAAESGSTELVVYLLSLNMDINDTTYNGETILHFAGLSPEHLELIKYLINSNMKVEQLTLNGESVLHYAVKSKNSDIVKHFLRLNLDLSQKTSNNESVLHYAARWGSLDVVHYLIGLNLKIDDRTLNDLTPLDYAIKEENIIVVKYLEERLNRTM